MGRIEDVAELLGGRKVLRASPGSALELHDLVRAGLPYASMEAVSRAAGLTSLQEVSEVLGIPERTLQRRGQEGRLSPAESERAVRLARVAQRAEEVLEDRERAHRWLRTPNRALTGKRPLDVLDTDVGARLVEDVLGRLEHTVYG